MGRLNCLSRKPAVAADPPVPSRPVYAIPHRPKAEYIKLTAQRNIVGTVVRQLQRQENPLRDQVQEVLPQEQVLNAMYNAVRRGSEGMNIPDRNYIEISDDEDPDDDVMVVARLPAPERQRQPYHHSNAGAESPLPAMAGNGPPQPGANSTNQAISAVTDLGAFIIEDADEFDVNDPYLAQIMMENFNRELDQQTARPPQLANQQNNQLSLPAVETKIQCIDQVLAIFAGICRDYVSDLYDNHAQSSDLLVSHILDKIDRGTHYPIAKDTLKTLKRKRQVDEYEEAKRKYSSVDRVIPDGPTSLRPYIRGVVSKEFPETPMSFIDYALNQHGYRLYLAYCMLEEAHRTFDEHHPPYNKIKHHRKMEDEYKDANLEATIQRMVANAYQRQEVEILRELQAARRTKKNEEAKLQAQLRAEIEEEKNTQKAQLEGFMSECGCCFGDYPLNRMVHCDHEVLMHWFCRGCAKRNADTAIGNSKYNIGCMSMDGCEAGFALDQRNLFLDETTIIALERNEQEAVLRMAGIENLASCPFCPYAAEYPPIDVNHEFRCQAPDCEKISCRLCKLESHIPKSCEEHAKENGLSIRRQIEEAMSAALIRKCNKCGTPFVKEEGCNKMTCTRNGCRNVQCYVCSKSCQYDHFDDTRRGGKNGNCPLFESVEDRHDNEVKKAEQEALDKVRAEHPEYTEEDLRVKMSENVKKDDERRKGNNPKFMHAGPPPEARVGYYGGFGQIPPAPVQQAYPRKVNLAPEMLANVNFNGHFGDEMFAGLWDNLPGIGQLPPAPPLRPVLPLRAPHSIAQVGHGQNEAPAFPIIPNILPPQEWRWDFGHMAPAPMILGAGELFPNIPRPSVAAQIAPPMNGNFQQIRNNAANLERQPNIQPPQLGNMRLNERVQERVRQIQQQHALDREMRHFRQ